MLVLVRDIAIIILAIESLLIGLFLIILIWQIRGLTRFLQDELQPIMDSATETVTTIRGTTVFLSDNVASPLIRVASFAAGVNRLLQTLRRGKGKSGE